MMNTTRSSIKRLSVLTGSLACLLATAPAALAAEEASEDTQTVSPLQPEETRGKRAVELPPATQAPQLILTAGHVMTADGETHSPGYVILRNGRIDAVGAGTPENPDGLAIYDFPKGTITPGIIDTHSHLGVYPSPWARAHSDGNEATSPTTPGVWAEHSVWPQDPGFQRAIAGGVTAMQILPGSANLIGGRGVIIQNVPTRGSRAMRFPGAPETIKMACGENPKRVYGGKGGTPSTRMGNLRGQRQAFLDAEAYLRTWEEYDETRQKAGDALPEAIQRKIERLGLDPEEFTPSFWDRFRFGDEVFEKSDKEDEAGDPPSRDLNLETLAGVIRGDILPHIHCYRADDMLSMLQVADEFGWQVRSFHHALEAYKIRDILAERDVAASTWADWWGFKMEAYDGIPTNAALLADAGGRAIIHSDSAMDIQRLNQEAAKAYQAGIQGGLKLSEEEAIRWITINPAWSLGIDDQTGSLTPGKRADVVVWDGHPFSVYSRAHWVFVEGRLRWDVSQTQPVWSDFQVGQERVQ